MNIRTLSNKDRIAVARCRPVPAGLVESLRYCKQSGKIYWAKRSGPCAVVGKEAGSLNPDGYRRINFMRQVFMAHRVVWLLVHGEWPDGEIDHIDGVRTNNRIENLRVVTQSENMRNKRNKSHETGGRNGVHFDPRCKKWRVQIRLNKKLHHLGLFASRAAALSVAEAFYISNGFTDRHATGRVG